MNAKRQAAAMAAVSEFVCPHGNTCAHERCREAAYLQACKELVEKLAGDQDRGDYYPYDQARSLMQKHGR